MSSSFLDFLLTNTVTRKLENFQAGTTFFGKWPPRGRAVSPFAGIGAFLVRASWPEGLSYLHSTKFPACVFPDKCHPPHWAFRTRVLFLSPVQSSTRSPSDKNSIKSWHARPGFPRRETPHGRPFEHKKKLIWIIYSYHNQHTAHVTSHVACGFYLNQRTEDQSRGGLRAHIPGAIYQL